MGQSAAEKTRGSPERYEAIETTPGPPKGAWRSPNRSSRNQSWGVAPIRSRAKMQVDDRTRTRSCFCECCRTSQEEKHRTSKNRKKRSEDYLESISRGDYLQRVYMCDCEGERGRTGAQNSCEKSEGGRTDFKIQSHAGNNLPTFLSDGDPEGSRGTIEKIRS